MEKHVYSGLGDQKTEHRNMVAKLHELAHRYEMGDFIVALDVLGFVKHWLTGHILGADMQYKTFFNGKGVS